MLDVSLIFFHPFLSLTTILAILFHKKEKRKTYKYSTEKITSIYHYLETGYRPDISLIWPVYGIAIKIINYVTFNGSDQYCEVAHILFSLCLSCRMKGQILILNSSRNRMVINLLWFTFIFSFLTTVIDRSYLNLMICLLLHVFPDRNFQKLASSDVHCFLKPFALSLATILVIHRRSVG